MSEPISAERLAEIRERAKIDELRGNVSDRMLLFAEVERLRAENARLCETIIRDRDVNREICEGIAEMNARLRAELEAAKVDIRDIT